MYILDAYVQKPCKLLKFTLFLHVHVNGVLIAFKDHIYNVYADLMAQRLRVHVSVVINDEVARGFYSRLFHMSNCIFFLPNIRKKCLPHLFKKQILCTLFYFNITVHLFYIKSIV